MASTDFGTLIREASARVAPLLTTAKEKAKGIEWYPYGTLTSVPRICELVGGLEVESLRGAPVLDLGSADGDLSFLFESLGFQVHAVDFPPANHNQMRGIAFMKEAVGARFGVYPRDINVPGELPAPHYGLMICLGVLYHLENPVGVLKQLARQGSYLLLSTRVLDRIAGSTLALEGLPLAYLAGAREVNDDPTNFWFFTTAGLERLFERSYWRVAKTLRAGARQGADEASADGRQFYLLESRYSVLDGVVLREGWHALEYDSYRWTADLFSVDVRAGASALEFDFYMPDGEVVLEARSGGAVLTSERFGPGEHTLRLALARESRRVEFRCTELPERNGDVRRLGVIVSFAGGRVPLRAT